MVKRRCDEDGAPLRACEVTFAQISDALAGITQGLAELRADVREVREQGIRMGASQEQLRASMDRDVRPALAALRGETSAIVAAHAQDCVGRRRALDTMSAPAAHPADSALDGAGTFKIPRWVIWAAIMLGLALSAGGGLLSTWISARPPATTKAE